MQHTLRQSVGVRGCKIKGKGIFCADIILGSLSLYSRGLRILSGKSVLGIGRFHQPIAAGLGYHRFQARIDQSRQLGKRHLQSVKIDGQFIIGLDVKYKFSLLQAYLQCVFSRGGSEIQTYRTHHMIRHNIIRRGKAQDIAALCQMRRKCTISIGGYVGPGICPGIAASHRSMPLYLTYIGRGLEGQLGVLVFCRLRISVDRPNKISDLILSRTAAAVDHIDTIAPHIHY